MIFPAHPCVELARPRGIVGTVDAGRGRVRAVAATCAAALILVAGCTSHAAHHTPPATSATSAPRAAGLVLSNYPDGSFALTTVAGQLRLAGQVFGLVPRTAYQMRLEHGTCLTPPANALADFGPFTASAEGAATTELTAPRPSSLPPPTRLLLYPATAAAPIGCTDLPSDATTAVRLYPLPGQRPSASAEVHYDAATNTVNLVVNGAGFGPDATYAVDLAAGSCHSAGSIKISFGDLKADREGTIAQTLHAPGIHAPLPGLGWYLTIRGGPTDALPGAGVPSAMYRPLLCAELTSVGVSS